MEFQGPVEADLAEVFSLNRAFLDFLVDYRIDESGVSPQLDAISEDVAHALLNCTATERDRLARAPFLLFSLAENDKLRWRRLFDRSDSPDLVDLIERPSVAETRLALAAIGLLWQFSRRSLYAARVVSGASIGWCERISEHTLVELFQFVSHQAGLLQLRLAHRRRFWRQLLSAGTADERQLRRAARITALQTVLTDGGDDKTRMLHAAACAMPMPSLKVAERSAVSKSAGHGYNTPPDESPANKKPAKDLQKR